MGMIYLEHRDSVAIVELKRGITNPIDLQLVNELANALHEIKRDPGMHGLVLSSSSHKFFSIGFDIPNLFELDKEDFKHFYRAYNQACLDLYTLPKPTVAAVTGHAIAGGCILALCCDYRYIAEGRRLMGLNEVKLGVPIPYVGDSILRSITSERNATEIMYGGEFYQPAELLQMGVVDQVLPIEQLKEKTVEKVNLLGAFPREAFAMIKRNRVEAVEEQILSRLEEKQLYFVECWYSEEGRKRIREAMDKF